MHRKMQIRTVDDLLDHVSMVPDTGCWLWLRSLVGKNGGEYPRGTVDGHYPQVLMHRWVCEQVYGPPPTAKHQACHSCDVASCVNPAHLRWGTASENADGTIGRAPHLDVTAVLTEEKVRNAKAWVGWGISIAELARKYGVSRPTMSLAIHGKTWRRVCLSERLATFAELANDG